MKAAEMAAQWWADRLESGPRERFREVLQAKIEAALSERPSLYLEVDYDPRGLLLEALREAGIECSGFMFSARGSR